jgi:Holliday junction resolvase
MPVQSERQQKDEFRDLLIDLFRRSGGHVVREPVAEDMRADLVVEYGDKQYLIECKRSAEGRRDRLVPLSSQAVLQAQAKARHFGELLFPWLSWPPHESQTQFLIR